MNELDEIEKYKNSNDYIPLDYLKRWMHNNNIEVQGSVADLLTFREYEKRIKPLEDDSDFDKFLLQYYERCLKEDPDSEYALSRYEVGSTLIMWFDAVPESDDINQQTFLIELKKWLEEIYRRSDEDIRLAIITGFLEHILEQKRWRPFFANWKTDSILSSAYYEAMEWAIKHERSDSSSFAESQIHRK